MSWTIGLAANGVIAVAYFALFFIIFRGLAKSLEHSNLGKKGIAGMLVINPLALATSFIFLTCGLGHAYHAIHAAMPSMGPSAPEMVAARIHFAAPQIWAVDILTAIVAVWYFLLRGRLPGILKGSAMYEDMLKRREQALDIQDHIAQGLAEIKLALHVGKEKEALDKATETMEHAQKIISDLLGSGGSDATMAPGRLRRKDEP